MAIIEGDTYYQCPKNMNDITDRLKALEDKWKEQEQINLRIHGTFKRIENFNQATMDRIDLLFNRVKALEERDD